MVIIQPIKKNFFFVCLFQLWRPQWKDTRSSCISHQWQCHRRQEGSVGLGPLSTSPVPVHCSSKSQLVVSFLVSHPWSSSHMTFIQSTWYACHIIPCQTILRFYGFQCLFMLVSSHPPSIIMLLPPPWLSLNIASTNKELI